MASRKRLKKNKHRSMKRRLRTGKKPMSDEQKKAKRDAAKKVQAKVEKETK